ncbi:MAG: type IV pilin-like G/H family protein [Thermodesulfobacteriota bacterium]
MEIRKPGAMTSRGFTLIELMIVVALIGLLSAMAIAIYSGYDCRTKQSEAKKNLSTIYEAQTAYYVEYNQYASTLSDIGFVLKSTSWYTYAAGGNDQTFLAVASNGPKGDAWSVDQNKVFQNLTNGCAR